ncbi:MAG: DnaJ domain-containing protein [Planctomycetes bacterium]|nr:DnaJ domain-containing protein [Planctomycetota bacterium]
MNPYEILGITPSSDDKAIRNAYLKLVKEYPPDRDPERFRKVAEAYDTLKDETKRLLHYLTNKDIPVGSPFEAVVLHAKNDEKRTPPGFEQLKELLRDV